MRVTRTSWIRAGIGLTALSALMLTGCAAVSDATAGFSDDAAEESAAAGENDEAPEAEETEEPEPEYEHRVASGFTVQSVAKELTATNVSRPSNNTVTTPTGTLTIKEVASLDEITAATAGLEEKYDEDTDEVLPYGPAEGEVFRVVELSFESSVLSDENVAPETDLSLKVNGTQTHLSELYGGYSERVLVSVPKDGSAQLVVSADGHNQFIDMLTGERADDAVAATYYRDVQRQEPHHVLQIESTTYPVLVDWSGLEEAVNTVDYNMQIDSVALAAWQPDAGWAPEGRAWAVVDWSYSVEHESTHYWADLRLESFSFDITVDSGSEQARFRRPSLIRRGPSTATSCAATCRFPPMRRR